MRILLVSTLKRKVTADTTASRSQIIYALGKGLAQKGHEVSLLGTEDSHIEGVTTIPVIEKGWADLPAVENPFYRDTGILTILAKKLEEIAGNFDIIHNHTYPEFINLLIAEKIQTPLVTTLHQQATPDYDNVLSYFPKQTFVGLSKAHQSHFTKASVQFVVYNGVDTNRFAFHEQKDSYLLWIGRLSKAKNEKGEYLDPKGVRWAIQLAEATGSKLLLSGAVEDQEFFDKDVKQHLSGDIKWVGRVSAEQPLSRDEVIPLMQKAKAFLMTINWEEPFGLVMAEAGSCGTPVIGFNRGSVREIVQDGVTGFVVDFSQGIEGLQKAFSRIESIAPSACRRRVEEHFSLHSMVDAYVNTYKKLVLTG